MDSLKKCSACEVVLAILVGIAPFLLDKPELVWAEVGLAVLLLAHSLWLGGKGCTLCKVTTTPHGE